jgi:hypothetical protein
VGEKPTFLLVSKVGRETARKLPSPGLTLRFWSSPARMEYQADGGVLEVSATEAGRGNSPLE